jgi:hypothetical protein
MMLVARRLGMNTVEEAVAAREVAVDRQRSIHSGVKILAGTGKEKGLK